MIIPGVLAQQALLGSDGSSRPIILQSMGANSPSSTSHSIALPVGWAVGDLCVIALALSANNTLAEGGSGMVGWARLTRSNTSGSLLTGEIWARVLQSGDASPTYISNNAGILSVRSVLVKAGTFDLAAPFVMVGNVGFGTSSTAIVNASPVSYEAKPWKILSFLFRRGTTNSSVTAYPLPENNGATMPSASTGCAVCVGDHDGGITPSGAWSLSASADYRTPVVLISPKPVQVRPLFVASTSSISLAAAFTADLPAGWSAGQLAILHVSSRATVLATPPGWNLVGSHITSAQNGITSSLFWRILQEDDLGPSIAAGTSRAAVIWTFAEDTFNAINPVVQIASVASPGLSTSAAVGASISVSDGQHYQMQLMASGNNFSTVSAYPFASSQLTRGLGTAPDYSRSTGCGGNFDGGVSPGSAFTLSANTYWATRKIAVIGKGYSA